MIWFGPAQIDALREWQIQNPGVSLWNAPCPIFGTDSRSFEEQLMDALTTPLQEENVGPEV